MLKFTYHSCVKEINMNKRLTYHCQMKEWELLKRFSATETSHIGSWYLICKYQKKNLLPGCRTIQSIESGTHRFHCVFQVHCSDSFLELTYVRNKLLTAIHAFILLYLALMSGSGIFSGTNEGLVFGFLSLVFCALLLYAQLSLKKKAFHITDQFVQTHILNTQNGSKREPPERFPSHNPL